MIAEIREHKNLDSSAGAGKACLSERLSEKWFTRWSGNFTNLVKSIVLISWVYFFKIKANAKAASKVNQILNKNYGIWKTCTRW